MQWDIAVLIWSYLSKLCVIRNAQFGNVREKNLRSGMVGVVWLHGDRVFMWAPARQGYTTSPIKLVAGFWSMLGKICLSITDCVGCCASVCL